MDKQQPAPQPQPATTTPALPVLSVETWIMGKSGDSADLTLVADKIPQGHIRADVVVSFYNLVCDPNRRFEGIQGADQTKQNVELNSLADKTDFIVTFPQNSDGATMIALAAKLENVTGATLGDLPDLPAIVSVSDHSVLEGDLSRIDLRLNEKSDEPVTLSYEFEDGTGVFNKDYVVSPKSGTGTFAPGKKNAKIDFATKRQDGFGLDDFEVKFSTSQPTEVVIAKRSDDGAYTFTSEAYSKVTIVDTEKQPELLLTANPKLNSSTKTAEYNFSLDPREAYSTPYGIEDDIFSDFTIEYTIEYGVKGSPGPLNLPRFDRATKTGRISINLAGKAVKASDLLPAEYADITTHRMTKIKALNSSKAFKVHFASLPSPAAEPARVSVGDAKVVEGQVAEFEFSLSEPLSEDLKVTYVAREIEKTAGIEKLNWRN